MIVLIVIALIALKYFLNWSIFDAASSAQGQSTIGYIRDIFNTIWGYISAPVVFIWDKIIWPLLSLIWDTFQSFLKWGQHNTTSTI